MVWHKITAGFAKHYLDQNLWSINFVYVKYYHFVLLLLKYTHVLVFPSRGCWLPVAGGTRAHPFEYLLVRIFRPPCVSFVNNFAHSTKFHISFRIDIPFCFCAFAIESTRRSDDVADPSFPWFNPISNWTFIVLTLQFYDHLNWEPIIFD